MTNKIDRRSKAYRDLVQAMPRPDKNIEEVLDGEVFRYLPEPRCRVCSAGEARKNLPNGSRVTNLVDTLLLYPKSMLEVLHTIEPLMEEWPPKARITYKSIRTHLHKHLGYDRAAMRLMVERWAKDKGISVLDAEGRMLLTEEAWLEATATKGWQALIRGDIEPSWKDAQQAWERMSAIRKQAEGEYSVPYLLAQLNAVIEVIRDEIPPERWPAVEAKLFGTNDVLELPPADDDDEVLAEIIAEQQRLEQLHDGH